MDRVLALVDAVIWVVDPEKYADAVLHERYLRPLAGHAEIIFVVLNQVDRLPGEAADQVLDDLRRLLDEDGIALGEHGEPGATVLALSALTGDGVGELREALGQFVQERGAAARRISADVDAAARAAAAGVRRRAAHRARASEARDEFAARLADAVGATAAGRGRRARVARNANRACGTPWLRLWRWYERTGANCRRAGSPVRRAGRTRRPRRGSGSSRRCVRSRTRRRPGCPRPGRRRCARRRCAGREGLPEALDELAVREAGRRRAGGRRGPAWWPAAVLAQASMTLLQIFGGLWLVGQIVGVMEPGLWLPVLLMVAGIVGRAAGRVGLRGWRHGGRRGGTGRRRSGGCGRRRPGAGGRGCSIRWRRSCCGTGRCGSSTGGSTGSGPER